MNKWSKSLPSINVLPDDTKVTNKPVRLPPTRILPSIKTVTDNNKFNNKSIRIAETKILPSIKTSNDVTKINSKPISIPQTKASTNEDSDSLTDVSVISPTKPSHLNHENKTQCSNSSNQYDSVIEIDAMAHNEFVPVDQLYDSLFAYANSFRIDSGIYSAQNSKNQIDSPTTIKHHTDPSSNHVPQPLEKNTLTRHKSCDDFLQAMKPTPVVKSTAKELLQAHIFAPKKIEHDDNGNHSDESTTVTDGSKFQWEYVSDSIDQAKKSTINITNNYQVTTKLNKLKSPYLQDPEQRSAVNCARKVSLSPIIIREKIKDLYIQQNIDIQFLRPPTPPLPTTPIIIREILHRPSPSNQLFAKQHSSPLSVAAFTEYNRSSKPPIVPKPKPSTQPERDTSNQPPKEVIIEYNQVNVSVAKNIHQREEIKRVDPNQYIQQHGPGLYSKEVFHDILTNIIS